jgi:hypothetical protein
MVNIKFKSKHLTLPAHFFMRDTGVQSTFYASWRIISPGLDPEIRVQGFCEPVSDI